MDGLPSGLLTSHRKARVTWNSAQPTLAADPIGDPMGVIRRLAPFEALAWLAFEKSKVVAAPVTTGIGLTNRCYEALVAAAIFATPTTTTSFSNRSLYGTHAWRYSDPQLDAITAADLLKASSKMAADNPVYQRREMWQALADAEVESYAAHLLIPFGFGTAAGAELVNALSADWQDLPLGERRYAFWWGLRLASRVCDTPNRSVRWEVIVNETRRKARWLALMRSSGKNLRKSYLFSPAKNWRTPILLSSFQELYLQEPWDYWRICPK